MHSNPGTQVEPAQNKDFALFQSQTKQEFRFICGTGFVYSNAFFKTSVFMFVDGVCAVAVFELFCVFNFFV